MIIARVKMESSAETIEALEADRVRMESATRAEPVEVHELGETLELPS